jgi:hypothetical protein
LQSLARKLRLSGARMLAARARPDGETHTHGTSHCVIPISPADARAVDPGAMASNRRNDKCHAVRQRYPRQDTCQRIGWMKERPSLCKFGIAASLTRDGGHHPTR